jgi:hypothetical protein
MNKLNVFSGCFYKSPRFWLRNIKMFFRCIKWSYQRITRGYCDADLWDYFTYHSELIIQSLTSFINNHNGFPTYLNDGTKIETDEEWVTYLTELVNHFKAGMIYEDFYDEMGNLQAYKDASDKEDAELALGFKMLENTYRNLWD